MTNEEYVTKILERVGPIIDVVGLFLVVKKIQEDEREACANRASVALLGTLQTTTDRVLKSIRKEQE